MPWRTTACGGIHDCPCCFGGTSVLLGQILPCGHPIFFFFLHKVLRFPHVLARGPPCPHVFFCPGAQNETAKQNRGVVHRNRGLEYIEDERLEGIVYVMDDDNTYSWEVSTDES